MILREVQKQKKRRRGNKCHAFVLGLQARGTRAPTRRSHLGELLEERVVLLEALLMSTRRGPLAKQVTRVLRP